MSTAPNAEPRRFEPDGPCMIVPDALARRWAARVPTTRDAGGYPMPYGMAGEVAVVSVDGPLLQRGGGYYFDGFDAVAERVKAALADPKARAVVLKLNSPGGMAAGCFEASRAIRAAAQASGKPLIAFADEMACSAAYALACAAQTIYLPAAGEVGSIGVLSAVVSMKRCLEAEGIDARVIRSGAMKASGHPMDPLTDEAVAREQADVDALAAQFFALVSSARGLAPEAVAALQGDTRLGAQAVAAGLADAVCTFEECVARAASAPRSLPRSTPAPAPITRGSQTTMSEKLASAVLALAGTTDEDTALGRLAAWKDGAARAAGLDQELAQLRASQGAAEREALIAGALTARKITPARAATLRAGTDPLCALPTKALAAHFEESPALAPASASSDPVRQPERLPGASAEVTLTDEEKRQAKAMGVTEADMLATKKEHLASA